MAMRAKLRQTPATGSRATRSYAPAEEPHGALRRVSLSLLLMMGAASLAGGTYVLYEALIAGAPRASPVMIEPRAHPPGFKSDLPAGRRIHG
jgi:hypothetical protein